MTPDEIKRLRELLGKATSGEWSAFNGYVYGVTPAGSDKLVCEHATLNDAALIAAAKNSMEALLDAAEERERLAQLARSACFHFWNCDNQCREHRETMARLARACGFSDPASDDDIAAALKEPS